MQRRGFGLRGGFRNQMNQQRPLRTGGALGKIVDTMMPALAQNKKIMRIGNNAQIINSYIQNMNKNKERGTPSSAVRTQAPNLYL